MPRPKDAKVWNEDLVQALRARASLSRQQGKRNAITLEQAAAKIESVRQNIFTYKNYNDTGRIVNFPSNLPKSIEAICRKIISGADDILPTGYIPTNSDEFRNTIGSVDQNYYENDYFLNNIKRRGGAYAILMAFRYSQSKTMTKQQIVRAAQPHCDEMMEANYLAGRPFGAWKSIETLEKHNLVIRQNNVRYHDAARGFRTLAPDSFTLTRDGERFIEALLLKHPDSDQPATGASFHASVSPLIALHSRVNQETPFSVTSTSMHASKPNSKNSDQDERELREWALEADIGVSKLFDVSKDRRKHLHNYCDMLNATILRGSGKMLRHESYGTGRSRELRVTMVRSNSVLPSILESQSADFATAFSPKSTPPRTLSGGAYILDNTSTKRARTLPPKLAAAEAALYRQAIHESASNTKKDLFPPDKINSSNRIHLPIKDAQQVGSDDDRKIPASRDPESTKKRSKLLDRQPVSIGICKDQEDGIIDVWQPVEKKNRCSPKSKDGDADFEALVDLTDSHENHTTFENPESSIHVMDSEQLLRAVNNDTEPDLKLIVYIDDRERNRNNTPRYLRMELSRLLNTGIFRQVWPVDLPKPVVEERKLKSGDFAFVVQNLEEKRRIPIWIERKRLGDLVQRSYSKDHWFQLHRMRDEANQHNGVCLMLLEGNIRTTMGTPYGAQNEKQTTLSHTIDSENCFWFFVGRAILSARSIRFFQTKDEQASLRAIGALSLIGLASGKSFVDENADSSSLPSKAVRTKLQDRLQAAGIPWKLASRVSDEIGSIENLAQLYSSVSEECRDGLLAHIISDLVHDIGEYHGTALTWSAAVHRCFFSALSDPVLGRTCFDDCYNLVEDHGNLLAKIHCGHSSCEAALNAVFDDPGPMYDLLEKVVEVTLPPEVENVFEKANQGHQTFYELHIDRASSCIPAVVMETQCSKFRSDRLFIFLMDGELMVKRLHSSYEQEKDYVVVSRQVAKSIQNDCLSHHSRLQPSRDTFILLIRGLGHAIDQYLKRSGCCEAMKTMVDLVLAECSIGQNMIILQAVHLQNDQDTILRQLAMACFHFQYLTHLK